MAAYGGTTTPSAASLIDFTDTSSLQQFAGGAASSLLNQGQGMVAQGQDVLGPVIARLMKIFSGNTAALNEATGPETTGVINQYDTARQKAAQTTQRGGGQASAITGSRFAEASQIAGIRVNARNSASDKLTQIAESLTQTGIASETAGTQELGNLVQSAMQADASTTALWTAIGKYAAIAAIEIGTGGAATPYLAGAAGASSLLGKL